MDPTHLADIRDKYHHDYTVGRQALQELEQQHAEVTTRLVRLEGAISALNALIDEHLAQTAEAVEAVDLLAQVEAIELEGDSSG